MDTKALRQKILNLAIRGKLVPQDPNDEPASVLIERIRAEKLQMVKDGKLKPKDIKNDTIIFKGDDNLHYEKFSDGNVKCIEDEIPFDVPAGWEWARLNDLALYKKGPFGSSITKAMFVPESDEAIKVYEQKNAINKNAHLGHYFISQEKYQELKGFEIFPGDIIVSCAGTIGETFVMPSDMRKGIINQALMKIHLYDNSIKDFYLMYFDNKLKSLANEQGYGMALKNIPPFSVLKQYLIPIPPKAEQEKILERIKIILSNINDIDLLKGKLQSNIANAESKILDLAIRGKLVPQDPNDEPASVLLEHIRAEKEELIKQGKIKRDKKESVIFKGDDNSYYQDLPENWQITSLREITTPLTLNDGDWILSQNMSTIGDVKLLQLGSIGNMVYIDKGFKYLTKDTFKELSCTEIFSGYLLINRIISDKMCCCIVPNIGGTIITTVDTCWIAPSNASYDIKFLMYQLASSTFQKEVLLRASGTTRRRISKNNLINIALLLPPLSEQKRIVEAIEKIFATLDDIANQVE